MRISEMLVLLLICTLFILGRPAQYSKQEQQAAPDMEFESAQDHIYKVVYEVTRDEEEPIADILWMKKAAQVAIEQGIPHFNVLHQKISKKFQPHQKSDLSLVEGTIELNPDPEKAEYDAQEINSLELSQELESRVDQEEKSEGPSGPSY